jgi:hypothetical protein
MRLPVKIFWTSVIVCLTSILGDKAWRGEKNCEIYAQTSLISFVISFVTLILSAIWWVWS